MLRSKSTANGNQLICNPFPTYLLMNFTDFETHFQAKSTDVLDPVAFLFLPLPHDSFLPFPYSSQLLALSIHDPSPGLPTSQVAASWIWTQSPALTVPWLLLSYCPCDSSQWVFNVRMTRTLSSVWLHTQMSSITSEITSPTPQITILYRCWIVNKYPKSTQKRSCSFSPSATMKAGEPQNFNRPEKILINISLLLFICISILCLFWQLHLRGPKISKQKKKKDIYYFFKDITKKSLFK